MTRIVRRERRKRGFFGFVFKWAFVLFNVFMAFWLISYWTAIAPNIGNATTEAYRAGATVGTAIGTGATMFFWVTGAVILGLFALLTRGKVTIIDESYSTSGGRPGRTKLNW